MIWTQTQLLILPLKTKCTKIGWMDGNIVLQSLYISGLKLSSRNSIILNGIFLIDQLACSVMSPSSSIHQKYENKHFFNQKITLKYNPISSDRALPPSVVFLMCGRGSTTQCMNVNYVMNCELLLMFE